MSQTPANWYPDPTQAGQLRYWDGAQWTAHVAPAATYSAEQTSAGTQATQGKMSGGAIAAIVIGCSLLVVIVIGILAAIAIPVFLNQRGKAADAGAKDALRGIATALEVSYVDNGAYPQDVTSDATTVYVTGGDGATQAIAIPMNVAFGGYHLLDEDTYCVWLQTEAGDRAAWQYSSMEGITEGSCG